MMDPATAVGSHRDELLRVLQAEGVALTADRLDHAATEYADLREKLAQVHASSVSAERPLEHRAAVSISEAGRLLRRGKMSSEMLTRLALSRIAALDGRIHAVVTLDAGAALAAARRADAELAAGRDRGPMHGIPYALKDIYDAAGLPTTCGSWLRLDHRAADDSAMTSAFRNAGAILLGKLDTFEFALGGPSFDLPFPPARNPWCLDRVPGGSSSGSGAAIAAGYVSLALGSCTTGSIRGPAAWCGAVGLKPTFGRVSRRGVYPLAGSLDHCGPLTRTVEDAAIALTVMAGHDPADPGSADVPVSDYLAELDAGIAGASIGVPHAFFNTVPDLDPDSADAIEQALVHLSAAGAHVMTCELPDQRLFQACGRTIMLAEAYAIHRGNLRTRSERYGAAAAGRFAIGASISMQDYLAALDLQRDLAGRVDKVFEQHDLLVTAISLAPAPPLKTTGAASRWPLQSTAFNVSGHPAISVPVGLSRDGLPLAVQIVGRRFDEALVLRAARALEKACRWLDNPLPQ